MTGEGIKASVFQLKSPFLFITHKNTWKHDARIHLQRINNESIHRSVNPTTVESLSWARKLGWDLEGDDGMEDRGSSLRYGSEGKCWLVSHSEGKKMSPGDPSLKHPGSITTWCDMPLPVTDILWRELGVGYQANEKSMSIIRVKYCIRVQEY